MTLSVDYLVTALNDEEPISREAATDLVSHLLELKRLRETLREVAKREHETAFEKWYAAHHNPERHSITQSGTTITITLDK